MDPLNRKYQELVKHQLAQPPVQSLPQSSETYPTTPREIAAWTAGWDAMKAVCKKNHHFSPIECAAVRCPSAKSKIDWFEVGLWIALAVSAIALGQFVLIAIAQILGAH